MSLDSKYNNYIYFSNRPDSIKVLSDDGEMVSIEAAGAALALGQIIAGSSNPDFSFKLIGGNTKTFPPYPADAFKFREEDDIVNRSSGINNLSFAKSNKIRTSDPFLNPNTSYAFEMKSLAMKFRHLKNSGLYHINAPSGLVPETFGYMNKVTAESLGIFTLFDNVLPSELDTDLKTTNVKVNFVFFKMVLLVININLLLVPHF